jgi:uncharacterized protein involved in exopolysaccharide biosynthesis
MEYFQIVWKRRWYALGVFILAASGSAIYAALIPDRYKSETRVVIEDLVRPDEFPAPGSRINSIRQLLSSRKFLEGMIEHLQMYDYGTRSDFVMEDAVKTAQKHIGIEETSRSTYIISFTASDPRLAQQVARHLGEELISARIRSRSKKMLNAGQFLDEMMRKTSKDLAAQEEKIKQFIAAHRDEFREQGNGIIATLSRSEKEKQEIGRQIKLLQSRLKLSPPLEQQFSDLLRELSILQKQFDDIRKKKTSIQLAIAAEADKRDETCRIIDEASLPVKPEFPNRMQIILMGIGGGLLLGIGAAFCREILDATISPAI